MRKKVAIIIPTLYSGGAEKQSVYLAKVLSDSFQVSLILLKGNRVEKKFLEIIQPADVQIVRLSGGLLKNMLDIFKIFRREKTEVVFSYLASSNMMNGVAGMLAGVPYRIGGIRNAELSVKKRPFERIFHNYFLTKTISNSHSAVRSLAKFGFKESRFRVIHNAYDVRESYLPRQPKTHLNILSVARFVPQKDYFTALQALFLLKQRLAKTKYTFTYFLVGYGVMENAIHNWIKVLKLEKEVTVVIKPENLDSYFKSADLFLTTSLFEGLSNSVMEALSFSLPIVATPAGDMEYLVKDNENGFLCDFGNAEQLAEKLLVLLKNYDLRIKMGKKSYEIIANDFTLEKFEKEYLSFIEKLSNEE